MLWSFNADASLMPASAVKLFTTGYARSVLGGNARRATRLIGSGVVDPKTGEWLGDWALEVNGDPSLERAQGSGPTLFDLATQLADAGVRRLSGPLQLQSADGPATAIYPAVWSRRHMGRLFAPLVGPLMVHENIVWFTVRPGRRVGERVRLIETAPAGISSLVTVTATTRSGRRSRLRLVPRRGGGWVVSGTLGVRAAPRRLTTVSSDPKAVLSAAWSSALKRAGITWNRTKRPKSSFDASPRVLAEVASPPLDSLASEINRRSLNAGAELLLQWAGGREDGPAHLVDHVQTITGQNQGVYLVDGSGLSYEDRVTASTFVSYLAKFPTTQAGRNFPQLLPSNGTGTLRQLNTGFPGLGRGSGQDRDAGSGVDRGRLPRAAGGHPAGVTDVQRRASRRGSAGAVEAVPPARRRWGGDSGGHQLGRAGTAGWGADGPAGLVAGVLRRLER